MISAISDGASVNTIKTGPQALASHCTLCFPPCELALKGSLGNDFTEIKEFMVTIY